MSAEQVLPSPNAGKLEDLKPEDKAKCDSYRAHINEAAFFLGYHLAMYDRERTFRHLRYAIASFFRLNKLAIDHVRFWFSCSGE
jgi:hypothetical protein